jgi:hypothetical protein
VRGSHVSVGIAISTFVGNEFSLLNSMRNELNCDFVYQRVSTEVIFGNCS